LEDVYKKARSSAGPMRVTGLSAGIPGTGISLNVGRNPDQPDNIYWLGDFAARTVPKFTLGMRSQGLVPTYLHAVIPLTWTILRVSDIAKPVAWMYADWNDFRSGRTVIALCGSVTNYRDLRPGTDNGTDLGWYPSNAMGLEAIMRAMADGREADVRADMKTADQSMASVADMAFTLTRLPRSHVLASGYCEVLAEIFTKIENFRTQSVEKIDTFLLGAPLWVTPTIATPLSTRSLPTDFQRAIQEDEIGHHWWTELRIKLANYIMPEKHFLYHDNPQLTSEQLLSNPALNIQSAPDERDS
jgi:hypothetical protein